jgi:hypothetical protein
LGDHLSQRHEGRRRVAGSLPLVDRVFWDFVAGGVRVTDGSAQSRGCLVVDDIPSTAIASNAVRSCFTAAQTREHSIKRNKTRVSQVGTNLALPHFDALCSSQLVGRRLTQYTLDPHLSADSITAPALRIPHTDGNILDASLVRAVADGRVKPVWTQAHSLSFWHGSCMSSAVNVYAVSIIQCPMCTFCSI